MHPTDTTQTTPTPETPGEGTPASTRPRGAQARRYDNRIIDVRVPDMALVVLIGTSSAGKSTFAAKHFLPTEIVSSDTLRGWVSDDEADQSATAGAFDVLHALVAARLKLGRRTVVDATNLRSEDRRVLIRLARLHNVLPVAVVFETPTRICIDRHNARTDRRFSSHVIRGQSGKLPRNPKALEREGFRHVFQLKGERQQEEATVSRVRLWNDLRHETGGFDIIGDVHGCYDELCALLKKLGYTVGGTRLAPDVVAPEGRRAVFVGDLVDRGPDSPGVLRLVMHMVEQGTALCVPGNHEAKLDRALAGKKVTMRHGITETLAQLAAEPEADTFKAKVRAFIAARVSHIVLDGGKLVVAHAGMKEAMIGRASGAVRSFALYGETSGEVDAYGLPVRAAWAADYRGDALVVHGHTPVVTARYVNNTLCVDTGCVFGGALTAMQYPARTLVSVPAARAYAEPVRPLGGDMPARADAVRFEDVAGKQLVHTRVGPVVRLEPTHTAAALETTSRFTVDPRWLITLPSTMAPPETAPDGPLLERPAEAFDAYRAAGLDTVVCEEKHMGSRAIVTVCRTQEAAAARFGDTSGRIGVVTTRSGRPFFKADADERVLLDAVVAAADKAGVWDTLGSDWLCLDGEILPWSAKAGALLRQQYVPVGAAGEAALGALSDLFAQAAARGALEAGMQAHVADRQAQVAAYQKAYRGFCWDAPGATDLKFAPFHVLASKGQVHADKTHAWHMDIAAQLAACSGDGPQLVTTTWRTVDLHDEASVAAATAWWTALTEAGGEGMVVKPPTLLATSPADTARASGAAGEARMLQPGLKVRGRDYLRIIYGPEYTTPANLERLRRRSTRKKRAMAIKETALGLEALHRFVEHAPLHAVHQCVLGVLAMEADPVDPRL